MGTSPDQNAPCFPVTASRHRHVKPKPWPRWPNAGGCPLGLFLSALSLFLKGATPPAAAVSRQQAELAARSRLLSKCRAFLQQSRAPSGDGRGRGQRLPAPGSQEPRPGREEEGGCVRECSRPPPADPRTPVRSAGLTSQGLTHSRWARLCTCTFRRPRRHRVLPSPATGGEAEAQR